MRNVTAAPYIDLLEAGSSSLVVGVVDPGGEPFATRAWSIEVVAADPLRLRVLLQAGSLGRIGRGVGSEPFAIAITAADVPTLQSVQVKGTARDLEPATDDDMARFTAYRTEFFETINRTDGYEVEALQRWAPVDVLAATVDVREMFDQTPGPAAGSRLPVHRP